MLQKHQQGSERQVTKRKGSNAVGIMVDLDSILDTRKGTIKKLYPKIYEEIKGSPQYHLRREDRWDDIHPELDHQQLTLAYQGRDLDTIRHSQLTMVSRMMIELFAQLSADIQDQDPEVAGFYVLINFHPYNLSIELKEEIAKLLSLQLGVVGLPIAEVSMPWKKLDAAFLKDNNIRYWYCYHYDQWLRECFEPVGTEQIDAEKITGAPETRMFAPMIAQDQKAVDKFLADIEDCPFTDQFQLTKAITSNIINFEFTPVSSFCQIDTEKLLRLEREKDMERSEILSTQEQAVNALMKRIGETPLISKRRAENYIDELEQLLFDLRAFNNQDTFSLFKQRLAQLNLTVSKLYNSVPFNSGEDLEVLIDHLSLSIDTNEKDFGVTEAHWNAQGVATIKTVEELDSGERLYRCIAATDVPALNIIEGQLLEPQKKNQMRFPPADGVNFLNYFER